jgi:hypothetical protein
MMGPMAGTSGKYRLDARLGGGGMAEVFLGSKVGAEGFSRKVAIKRVLAGFSDNPSFADMFIAEARISARLVHPNIVSVLDFDRDDEHRLFLVMELVEGKDLDSLVATGLLSVPVVIFVIGEVLRALAYAHDLPVGSDVRGVVHRDVSPHNVLLSWEGAVKLSDFGIAKARAASEASASEFIKGKPAYMSPEQANSQRLDGRSDLFAVGVMLWEMLVGRRLFVAEDTRATLAAVLFGQIPRPRSLRSEVPRDLERVCMKLLERDLPARYANAELALRDLLACTDAARDGRELLVKLLAERFPHAAPRRQSELRLRGKRPGAVVAAVQPSDLPSIGAARAAQTATVRGYPRATWRNRQHRVKLVTAMVAGFAVAALGTFLAVKQLQDHHRAAAAPSALIVDARVGDGTAPPSGSDRQARPAVVDAPTPPVVHDADAAIAAIATEPQRDTGVLATRAASGRRVGQLAVSAFPVLTVYVDTRRIGDSPISISLPVGKHTVRLVNTDVGHDEKLVISINENQTTRVERQ